MNPSYLVPLILLVAAMSGCAESASPSGPAANDDPPSSVVVEPEPGVFVAENRGVLRLVVKTDGGLPLANARASLLKTDSYGDTGRDGRLLLGNVTVGNHTLSVQATNFKAYLKTVEIRRGQITDHEVFMNPAKDVGAGSIDHKHDYWGDQTEITLINHNYDFTGPERLYEMNVNSSGSTTSHDWHITFPDPPGTDPLMIYPGAREIQITLTWTETSTTFKKLGLQYATAKSNKVITLDRRASGQPWTIPVQPGEWDAGHQKFSLWEFMVCPCNDVRTMTYEPGTMLGLIHVKLVVIKGDEVPAEPGHPNHWGDAESLILRPYTEGSSPQGVLLYQKSISAYCLKLPSSKIVPPGATKMRIEFRWAYNTGNNTPLDREYELRWRTGGMDPAKTGFQDLKKATATKTASHYRLYELDLERGETDAYYQTKSTWCFMPVEVGHETQPYDMDPGRGHTFYVGVTVWRDPTFSYAEL
jgi:hypothetical protein